MIAGLIICENVRQLWISVQTVSASPEEKAGMRNPIDSIMVDEDQRDYLLQRVRSGQCLRSYDCRPPELNYSCSQTNVLRAAVIGHSHWHIESQPPPSNPRIANGPPFFPVVGEAIILFFTLRLVRILVCLRNLFIPLPLLNLAFTMDTGLIEHKREQMNLFDYNTHKLDIAIFLDCILLTTCLA